MYLSSKGDAIQILEWRFSYFPKRFRWRGQQFEVVRVERVHSTRREWPRKSQYRIYSVDTYEGPFELCHDLLHDMWRMRKSPAHLRVTRRLRLLRATRGTRSLAHGHRLALVR